MDATFFQYIFDNVMIVGFVTKDLCPHRQVKTEVFQPLRVTVSTAGQKELDWLTGLRDHHMNGEAIKVAPFARFVPSIFPTLIEAGTGNPNIITHGDGKCVNRIDRFTIQFFEGLAQHAEQTEKKRTNPVQPSAKPTFAYHAWHITLFFEQRTRQFIVAAKEKRRHNRNRHHFAIAHCALRIFVVVQRL